MSILSFSRALGQLFGAKSPLRGLPRPRKPHSSAHAIAVCAVSVVIAVSSWCRAENARSDAMGGISIINDFNHTIYNPASLNDFPDQLSGSAGTYTDTDGIAQNFFGPVLGKLSVGDLFNVGFVGNTVNYQGSSVLRGAFYKKAQSFYIQNTDDTLPAAFPMIPHVLLGRRWGNLGIGVEGFYEAAHHRRSVVSSNHVTEEGIYNYGAKLNANIDLKNFWLCPLVGWGSPFIKGETFDSTVHSINSDRSAYATAGMEIGAELSNAILVAGVYGSSEAFSFTRDQSAGPEYTSVFYDGYLGCMTYPFPNFLLAFQYDLSLEFDDAVGGNMTAPIDYHDVYQYHALHAGVERTFETDGIFESIVPRAGIVYSLSTFKEQEADTVSQFPLNSYGMQINAGIGATKDMFHLDVFVNIGNWNGVLTGPRAASVTLTIGLSKKFLDKRSDGHEQ